MKKSTAMLGFVLAGAIAAGGAGVFAYPAEAAQRYNYDYSRPNSADRTTLGAAELIERYLSAPLGSAERGFLQSQASFSLTYSESVGISSVDAVLENDMLEIAARPVSYLAANNRTVTWTPRSADGAPLLDGGNEWTLQKEIPSDADFVTVEYEAKLFIGKEDLNGLLNAAYLAGMGASEKLRAEEERYRGELAAWEEASAAYETYLSDMQRYEEECAAYESELAAHKIWQAEDGEYRQYLAERERYLAQQEEYNAYLAALSAHNAQVKAYQDYLFAQTIYERELAAYEQSTASADAQTALRQISYLDFVFEEAYTPKGRPRTLYNAIMGDSVTQVLKEKKLLTEQSVSLAAIELAEDATYKLREDILPRLAACKTDASKYAFYIAYYEKIRDSFTALFRALDFLYQYDIVYKAIRQKDRLEEYKVLLAQLFTICNLLSEDEIPNFSTLYPKEGGKKYNFDDSYRIGGERPAALLLQAEIPAEGDPKPLAQGYPSIPEKPVPPAPVASPSAAPAEVKEPVAPEPVSPPSTEPTVRTEPVLPMPVDQPSEKPSEYVPAEGEAALAAAYDGGELQYRAEAQTDYYLPVTSEVVRYFRNAKEVIVEFYLEEGGAPAYTAEGVAGSPLDASPPQPQKKKTGYTCTFECWTDERGERVDLRRLPSPEEGGTLRLYPRFTETPNSYEVIWQIGEERESALCLYGERPVYDGTPTKAASMGRSFRFTGWQAADGSVFDPLALPAMTERGAVYTAVFENSLIITWRVNGTETRTSVWHGETPVYPSQAGLPSRPADSRRYIFIGWDREPLPATGDAVYTALFREEYLIPSGQSGAEIRYGETLLADCSGVNPASMQVGAFLLVAAEQGLGARLEFLNCTLSMNAGAVRALAEAGVCEFILQTAAQRAYAYTFSLGLRDGEGNTVPSESRYSFVFKGKFDEVNSALIATDAGGETSSVRFEMNGNELSFSLRPNTIYEIYPRYKVNVIGAENVGLQTSAAFAREGERVEIDTGECEAGYYIEEIYVLDPAGNALPVEDNAFIMPACAVSVGVRVARCTYTVKWVSAGKTLYTQTCHYGDAIVAPELEVVRADDDEYRYTFTEWEGYEEGLVCTEDIEFHAQFSRSPVPPRPVYGPSKYYYMLLAAKIGFPILLAAIVALIVFFVVRHIRKKRRSAKLNTSEAPMPETEASLPPSDEADMQEGREVTSDMGTPSCAQEGEDEGHSSPSQPSEEGHAREKEDE